MSYTPRSDGRSEYPILELRVDRTDPPAGMTGRSPGPARYGAQGTRSVQPAAGEARPETLRTASSTTVGVPAVTTGGEKVRLTVSRSGRSRTTSSAMSGRRTRKPAAYRNSDRPITYAKIPDPTPTT